MYIMTSGAVMLDVILQDTVSPVVVSASFYM